MPCCLCFRLALLQLFTLTSFFYYTTKKLIKFKAVNLLNLVQHNPRERYLAGAIVLQKCNYSSDARSGWEAFQLKCYVWMLSSQAPQILHLFRTWPSPVSNSPRLLWNISSWHYLIMQWKSIGVSCQNPSAGLYVWDCELGVSLTKPMSVYVACTSSHTSFFVLRRSFYQPPVY